MNCLVVILFSLGRFVTVTHARGQHFHFVENVILAVNFGGQHHTDIYGIEYEADTMHVGTASNYGVNLKISRVHPFDAILYQTERYHTDTFTYTMPSPREDGEYTLVLKFCEVYFLSADKKVFDVLLNGITIISNLDIFAEAKGLGVAHDRLVTFHIEGANFHIENKVVQNKDGLLLLTFVKGFHDNPKINALYLYRGPKKDIPPLPDDEQQLEEEEDDEEEMDFIQESETSQIFEGAAMEDPFSNYDASQLIIPFLIGIACFFPIIYCLCRF